MVEVAYHLDEEVEEDHRSLPKTVEVAFLDEVEVEVLHSLPTMGVVACHLDEEVEEHRILPMMVAAEDHRILPMMEVAEDHQILLMRVEVAYCSVVAVEDHQSLQMLVEVAFHHVVEAEVRQILLMMVAAFRLVGMEDLQSLEKMVVVDQVVVQGVGCIQLVLGLASCSVEELVDLEVQVGLDDLLLHHIYQVQMGLPYHLVDRLVHPVDHHEMF